jgi:membrane fusion protein (multidrug efflux system)
MLRGAQPDAQDAVAAGPGNVARLREAPAEEARDAPKEAPASAPAAPAAETPQKPKRKGMRRILLLAGPLVLIAAGFYFYLSGGRWVSTDNAYVRADKLNVSTDVSGIVAEIPVKENQKVVEGQVLFRLDDTPFRITLSGAEAQLGVVRNEIATLQATYRRSLAEIEQAKTDIAFYETAFERQQDLSRRGVSSQAALDQAKRDLDAARERVSVAQRAAEVALSQLGGKPDDAPENYAKFKEVQADVDKAKRDLSHTIVKAPMNGIVTNVNSLQVGQYLPVAQAAFSLVATDHVWVDANLKETDLTYLKPGDPAIISVDTYPGREWSAKVVSVAPATGAEFSVLPAQNASGNWVKVVQRVTVRLAIEVPPDAPPLRSGMSTTAEIDTGHERTLAGLVDTLKHHIGL